MFSLRPFWARFSWWMTILSLLCNFLHIDNNGLLIITNHLYITHASSYIHWRQTTYAAAFSSIHPITDGDNHEGCDELHVSIVSKSYDNGKFGGCCLALQKKEREEKFRSLVLGACIKREVERQHWTRTNNTGQLQQSYAIGRLALFVCSSFRHS